MDGIIKLARRCALAGVALAAIAVPVSAALTPAAASASNPKTALLDSDSVTFNDGIEKEGAQISLEQYAAEHAGYTVTVRSGAEWEAMSAPEFAQYQVLIIGDPDCRSTAESAVNSAGIWTPVVMTPHNVGNRVVVGTDPEFHYAEGGGGAQPTEAGNPSSAGAEHLVQDGITFAGGVEGATGIYFDTSCSDLDLTAEEEAAEGAAVKPSEIHQPQLEGPDGRDKNDILEHLTEAPSAGAWTENTDPPCGGSVQQVAANAVFDGGETKLLDSNIQGWGCSDHITFPTFPADWFPLAVATDTPSHPTCGTDPETESEVCGEAYVLLAGRGIVATAPNLSLSPPTGSSPAGGTHTVVANVHKEGAPIAGIAVHFHVTGQNGGVTGTCTNSGVADPGCTTDANGNVEFTYSDTNGAGEDAIIATVTLESACTEVPDESPEFKAAAVCAPVLTNETASASQIWTPAAVVVTTPAPTTAVLATKKTLAAGTAHLASTGRACVASSGYTAKVSGKDIASVTFTLDGHKLKTIKTPNSHGAYTLHIGIKSGKPHHLRVNVAFSSASKKQKLTIVKLLARCAAVHVKPTFTG